MYKLRVGFLILTALILVCFDGLTPVEAARPTGGKRTREQKRSTVEVPQDAATDSEASEGTPFFGLIGLSASDPSIEPTVATSSRMGIFLGFGAEFKLEEWAFFQPELNYVQKGMEQSDGTVTVKYAYNNVEAPFFLKAKWFAGDFNPFLLTGPVFGWNIKSEKTTTTATGSSTRDLGAVTENFEFSWTTGVGAEVPISDDGDALLGQVRYEYGITDVDTGAFIWKNRVFQFLVGYQTKF